MVPLEKTTLENIAIKGEIAQCEQFLHLPYIVLLRCCSSRLTSITKNVIVVCFYYEYFSHLKTFLGRLSTDTSIPESTNYTIRKWFRPLLCWNKARENLYHWKELPLSFKVILKIWGVMHYARKNSPGENSYNHYGQNWAGTRLVFYIFCFHFQTRSNS